VCQCSIADGYRHDRYVTVGGRANRRLRQLPARVLKLRLKLRNRGVDTTDLGVQCQLRALLCSLGGGELRRHGLVLNLLVLRLELRVGIVGGELVDIGETLLVVGGLRGKSLDIRARLLVIRFQDLCLLLRRRERGLQLLDLILKRRRVDLKQYGVFLHRHVRLDRDGDDLSCHTRLHFRLAARDRHAVRWREIKSAKNTVRINPPVTSEIVPDNQA